MALKRSSNSTPDDLLTLLGSEERQFVELGRQLSLDDLVKSILKLSERLGVEGRKRIIRAFTEHNFAAEFEDNPQGGSRFRNDCFEYTSPYANSPNYSVKLYWWDREKLHRQYIGTIPFKRDQIIRLQHRTTGKSRIVLCEGLYTDRSLFELVPAIKQFRQEEAQKRRSRNEARKNKQPLPEYASDVPELGIELRLKQLLPTSQSFIFSYPGCLQNELREDDWQIEILSESEFSAIKAEYIQLEHQALKDQDDALTPLDCTTHSDSTPSKLLSRSTSKKSKESSSYGVAQSANHSSKSKSPTSPKRQPATHTSASSRSSAKIIDPTPTMRGLALLSQLTEAPMQLTETTTQVFLSDSQNRAIITFDPTTQQLQSSYSSIEFLQLLEKLVKIAFRHVAATDEQQQMATRLKVRLQGAKHQKPDELLNYLMGTPSKRRKIEFDDRSHAEGRSLRSE
ncbi:hypothetical protein NIES2135_67420 (plasmid) [Leptolyngbya boryana NIES-2135]|jgi:hypothetical protein|uniref:Uncharacterized protein n=1 Tax=Leptolyngbya boryana NIES-2135 TaxID=1973484 RepID=A0A1Z4JSW2_LEPBY|nr:MULTISPECIES: hypothetical protein [Leptolyngbya]BAY59865.1 hypothetical protein NIES2135_67420 [Leptolyngbya boryana NIES-2135]MBD2369584.1 hypothetical protein [Leptolyngbya sp. FACHB-161]MBD2375971.1 hypothetical protein [Leptolyngbya sp. FACHB-238]MBD2400247.1 hypothetical protein [Leptolyngbya sp. FACHB-239]MBD2406789.1 hypothetical protein [Leptolyngbya sp. FACHB-402]